MTPRPYKSRWATAADIYIWTAAPYGGAIGYLLGLVGLLLIVPWALVFAFLLWCDERAFRRYLRDTYGVIR